MSAYRETPDIAGRNIPAFERNRALHVIVPGKMQRTLTPIVAHVSM
jgi:hypothetical protein